MHRAGPAVSWLAYAGARPTSWPGPPRAAASVSPPSLPSRAPPPKSSRTLRQRREEVLHRRVAIAERLGALARDWYPTVAAIDEALQIENRKVEVLSKVGAGRSTFALESWVPSRDVPRLETVIQDRSAEAGRTSTRSRRARSLRR